MTTKSSKIIKNLGKGANPIEPQKLIIKRVSKPEHQAPHQFEYLRALYGMIVLWCCIVGANCCSSKNRKESEFTLKVTQKKKRWENKVYSLWYVRGRGEKGGEIHRVEDSKWCYQTLFLLLSFWDEANVRCARYVVSYFTSILFSSNFFFFWTSFSLWIGPVRLGSGVCCFFLRVYDRLRLYYTYMDDVMNL